MLRVIVADDEERICRLIRALADWPRLGMEVVGEAHNGLDAQRLVDSLRPDILITDIRMPGCDGLELIAQAKAVLPALEVIIISGYAQFDYAKTAIRHGVGDYLLKPINQEELNATLEKMGQRCRARRQTQADQERLRLGAQDERDRRREQLIPDLLDGRYPAQDERDLAQAYGFAGQGTVYQVFLLKMDYDLDQYASEAPPIVREKARDIFDQLLRRCCGEYVLGERGPAVYGVLRYDPVARDDIRKCLRACLNQMIELRNLFGPIVFSMALGVAVDSPRLLGRSMRSAGDVIAERLIEGTDRLLEGDAPTSGLAQGELLARYTQAISQAIDVLDAGQASAAVQALCAQACATSGVRGRELLALVCDAGAVFVTCLGLEGRAQALAAFEARCGQCADAPALFACLNALQAEQIEQALALRQSQGGQSIRVAKQYIRKHFASAITLEDVSAATGFSVNYFSTLFKKETGEGFAKYLTRVRMEEAKTLLRETRIPVQEVCGRVGYGDLKHFTRTFRAETGITPGEFRKLYG